MENGTIYRCEDSHHSVDDFYQFFPVYVGHLMQDHQEITYSGQCFKEITFKFEYLPSYENPTSVKVKIQAKKKKSLFCREHLFLSTSTKHHLEELFLARTHTLEFKNLDSEDIDDIKADGVRMFMFCAGISHEFISVFNTMKLFIGGLGDNPKYPIIGSHVPKYMEKANVKFIEETIGWKMQKRATQKVYLSDDDVQDGDFLSIIRLDGLDEIIMWGTGGVAAHTVVVLTIDGVKQVVEAQDAWYWPIKNVQKNPFQQWVKYADNADFNVIVLPLKDELRAKFDLDAAVKWYNKMEGLPYGFHNFLFSWIDTPDKNFPDVLPSELLPVVFDLMDHILPSAMTSIFFEAMNQRLGTQNLRMKGLASEAAHINMTLMEVAALPEQDDWIYSDGPSYVCSCFVIGVYKAAGLFGDLEINANEFSPKDLYQLDFFNKEPVLPKQCTAADPDLPYCQILGKYKYELIGYSTIKPYSHMNEHCPTQGPDYIRPEGC